MRKNETLDPGDAEIVTAVYGDLLRFASAVAPAGDDPADLAQEAFARVLARQHLETLDEPAVYLRRVVLNLANNRRRSLRRRARALTRLGAQGSAADSYPSDVEALLSLSPQTRAVLWMADVEGHQFEEIARRLAITTEAARQRASRGRADLQRRFVDGEFDAPQDPLPAKTAT